MTTYVPKYKNLLKTCYSCSSDTTTEYWNINKDINGNVIGFLCNRCYEHLIHTPKKVKSDKESGINKRKIEFCGISVWLGWDPKSGKCSICERTVRDGQIKYTNLHHWFYLIIMPWACTIEACRKCHNKIHEEKLKMNLISYYNRNRKVSSQELVLDY